MGRYINCEIVNWLNQQINNQQGDKIRDSLDITVVCTSHVGLVIGGMDMRFTLRIRNSAGAEIVSSSRGRRGFCPFPPAQEYHQRHNRGN